MFNPDSDEIGDIISHSVNQNVTIDKLRDLAMEHSVVKEKITEKSHLRLREKQGKKSGPILYDGLALKDALGHPPRDQHTILIQILDTPEFIKPNEMLLHVKQWFRQNRISKKKEKILFFLLVLPLKL